MTNMIMTLASLFLLGLASRAVYIAIYIAENASTAAYSAWTSAAMFLFFAVSFAWFPLSDIAKAYRKMRNEMRSAK